MAAWGSTVRGAAHDIASFALVENSFEYAVAAHAGAAGLTVYRAISIAGSSGAEVVPIHTLSEVSLGPVSAVATGNYDAARHSKQLCLAAVGNSVSLCKIGFEDSPMPRCRISLAGSSSRPSTSRAASVALDIPTGLASQGNSAGTVTVHNIGMGDGSGMHSALWTGQLSAGSGPAVSALSFWPYSRSTILAAGGASVHMLDVASSQATRGPVLTAATHERPLDIVTCLSLHPEDPYCVLAGTDSGDVVRWDLRQAGATVERVAASPQSPVTGITVVPTGVAFACSEDGGIRRLPCRHDPGRGASFASGSAAGAKPAPQLHARHASRLNGIAWLQDGASPGVNQVTIAAAADTGAVHYSVAVDAQ